MTTRLAPFFLLGLALQLQGCVIYETDGSGGGDFWYDDGNGNGGNGGDQQDTGGDTNPQPQPGFTLSVAHAAAGSIFLTKLQPVNGADLSAVVDVHFAGPVTVDDTVLRDDGLALLCEVDAAAQPGAIEVWVEMADGTAVLVDAGFVVDDPASGGSDDGSGCN